MAKVKIRLCKDQVVGGAVWHAGAVVETNRRSAQRLINAGIAEPVADKREPAKPKREAKGK